MKKNFQIILAVFMVFCLAALVACGAKEVSTEELLSRAKNVNSFSADMEMNSADEKVQGKVMVMGKNMRMEMEDPSMGGKFVTILNADEMAMYMYSPDEKSAMKMALEPSDFEDDDFMNPLYMMGELAAPNMKKVGEEKVDGKDAYVYEVSIDGETGKMWLWKEHGFPLKIEAPDNGGVVTIVYSNVKVGEVSAADFKLPEDVEIMDMDNWMDGFDDEDFDFGLEDFDYDDLLIEEDEDEE